MKCVETTSRFPRIQLQLNCVCKRGTQHTNAIHCDLEIIREIVISVSQRMVSLGHSQERLIQLD